ncbi:MAG: glutaminyl-peptide cyclotransferase [Acidobacteriota bacterium]|nr:glutaminyl-peptide cyclotransferase [Acidobacteriota bacterium]
MACSKEPERSNASMNVNKSNAGATKTTASPTSNVPVYTYEIVNTYNHDPNAFTQGLFFHDGFLYEGTGGEGKSSLRKVELETGRVVQRQNLDKDSFGEGATVLNGKIYQLTWQEETAYVYDAETLKPINQFRYQGDGWGLTSDGKNLYMTDSTHVIRVLDPETFKPVRMISVFREDGKPLMQINELEFIKGELWANVWHSEDPRILGKPNYIARIDPQTGKLLGWIDLDGISPEDVKRGSENTLNGIAYDAANDRIFVTGKNWRKLFEIKVKPKT